MSALQEVSTELVQADHPNADRALASILETIGRALGASQISVRMFHEDDGLLHSHAHWRPAISDPQPGADDPVELTGEFPFHPVVVRTAEDLPFRPVGGGSGEVSDDRSPVHAVICPIGSGTSGGGLLIARDVAIGSEVLASFALGAAASMIGQFLARIAAERNLQRQVELNDLVRQTSERFLSVAPGEDTEVIDDALAAIGDALKVCTISLWERTAARAGSRTALWQAQGVEAVHLASINVDVREVDGVIVGAEQGQPYQINSDELEGLGAIVGPVPTRLEYLVVPMDRGPVSNGVMVVGHQRARIWQPWELDSLRNFAALIPTLRQRLAVEEQLVTAFHASPLGIVMRTVDGRLFDCNQSFLDFLGCETEMEVLHTYPGDVMADLRGLTAADDYLECFTLADQPRRREHLDPVDLPFRHIDGSTIWGRVSVESMLLSNEPMILSHIEDVTDSRSTRLALEYMSTHDDLTGLPNRRALHGQLSQLIDVSDESLGPVAVVLDLNGFKAVNDSQGHAVGDEVLRVISDRLRDTARSGDIVTRLGGDEFVLVLGAPVTDDDVSKIVNRLQVAVSTPVHIEDRVVRISASVGTARWEASDRDGEALIRRADQAMYLDKADRAALRARDIGPRQVFVGPEVFRKAE